MSTKGNKLSLETKWKISLANTIHTREEFIEAWERYEIKLSEDPKRLPTIGGYCLEVGISQNNILEYSGRYPEVSEIVSHIFELQQEFCLVNGITQRVNPIFSMFLLKSTSIIKTNHGSISRYLTMFLRIILNSILLKYFNQIC